MGLKSFNGFNAINANRHLSQCGGTERFNRLCQIFNKHKNVDVTIYIGKLALAQILNRDEVGIIQAAKTNSGKLYELVRILSPKPLKLIKQFKLIAYEMNHNEFAADLDAEGF